MTGSTVSLTLVQNEPGDYPHRLRDISPPPVMRDVDGLSPWLDTTREALLQSGDCLCIVRYHQRQDLEKLTAQFRSDTQVFDAIGYNLGRDRLHGAFLWLRELRGIQL